MKNDNARTSFGLLSLFHEHEERVSFFIDSCPCEFHKNYGFVRYAEMSLRRLVDDAREGERSLPRFTL